MAKYVQFPIQGNVDNQSGILYKLIQDSQIESLYSFNNMGTYSLIVYLTSGRTATFTVSTSLTTGVNPAFIPPGSAADLTMSVINAQKANPGGVAVPVVLGKDSTGKQLYFRSVVYSA
jgi:hypothetical protein